MLLLSIIALTLLVLIAAATYAWAYASGLKAGLLIQNAHYAIAYQQVLSVSTEENKKRMDDAADAQMRVIEAARQTNDAAIASTYQSKPQA